MNYKEHKQKWMNCTLCHLHKKRTKVVLARGKIPAHIVFVGEAPGFSEDVQGLPFIGPAGHLLDEIIEESTTKDIRYAITNLISCIPLDEQELNQKVEEPLDECVKECAPRLMEFLNLSKPKIIVCVGDYASRYLKPKSAHNVRELPEFVRSVISITHPAAILRKPYVHQTLAKREAIITIQNAIERVL